MNFLEFLIEFLFWFLIKIIFLLVVDRIFSPDLIGIVWLLMDCFATDGTVVMFCCY
jgi:hypothetical protein